MRAQELFEQVRFIEQQIRSNLRQLSDLRDISVHATATLSDLPRSPRQNTSRLEGVMVKIVDLENSIAADIELLVETKTRLRQIIQQVPAPEHRLVLELRYLNHISWDQISIETGYSRRYLYKLLDRAMSDAEKAMKVDTFGHIKTPKDTT